ncbi:hypothetical protein RND81_05G108300 [Saponaria officinalis]|uniref:Uncharacterized protein n=1 Tax=Saponaria officinalis TaxID=3572 RepID=A0AAW1KX46_SAPOF
MGSPVVNERDIMGDNEASSFATTLATGVVVPMVLNAVIELDVFEIIKRFGPGAYVTPAQIANKLSTNNPNAGTMLDRMLRILASHSILSCSTRPVVGDDGRVEMCYGLTPVSQFFTKGDDGVTLTSLLRLIQDKVTIDSLSHLKDTVLEGICPFEKAYGMSQFEFTEKDSRFNKIFNKAMANHSFTTLKKIMENYKGFEGISTLVDIGGGNGTTLNMIISKYPSIRGINLDLPHVLANAPSYEGVEHVPGDMFVSVPKGDAMFMKWITHDWSDEECIKLLTNCYDALPEHGKVIICDYIVPMWPETSDATRTVLQLDVLMMAISPEGKERTELEFKALAKRVGFQGFRVVCSAYDTKIMECIKGNH